MKKITYLLLLLLFLSTIVYSQGIERGDSEVLINAFYFTNVGTDYSYGSGNITGSYGYYFTNNLQIGIGPGLSIYTQEDEVETDFSGQLFTNYNFSTTAKTIPYIKGSYYQATFDIDDDRDFTDYGYVQIGAGMKNFISENIALDSSVTYGFSLAENAEGGSLLMQSGLSLIF